MASIARKNLFEDIPRFLIAQAGIMFAVSLVTIQTGILNGFTRSTSLLIDSSKADIWVGSKYMVSFELSLPIPYEGVEQAQKVAGVERSEALIVQGALWRDKDGNIVPVRAIGFDPASQLFAPGNIERGNLSFLNQPYTVIADQASLKSLNVEWVGDEVEMGAFRARLVGWTRGNQSIVSNSFLFTSLENAYAYVNSTLSATSQTAQQLQQLAADGKILDPALAAQLANLPPEQLQQLAASGKIPDPTLAAQLANLSPQQLQQLAATGSIPAATAKHSPPAPRKLTPNDRITYILVRAKPGENLEELKRNLEAAMPDIRAYTRTEIAARTRSYWLQRTGIGFILGLGAAVGVIVGTVIVGQILYASASDHIKEFGTLKAMGASDWVIYGIIVEQALWMAVLGYLPGMVVCWGVGKWTLASQGIVILITPATAGIVFGITVVMCVSSALFAIQKVTRLDPAVVFKA